MPCNCRKYAPKGRNPLSGAKRPTPVKVSSPSGANQAAGYARKYGIKVAPPKVTKATPKPPKVSARVAKYREQEAKALAKANANPCKCTPGKP